MKFLVTIYNLSKTIQRVNKKHPHNIFKVDSDKKINNL